TSEGSSGADATRCPRSWTAQARRGQAARRGAARDAKRSLTDVGRALAPGGSARRSPGRGAARRSPALRPQGYSCLMATRRAFMAGALAVIAAPLAAQEKKAERVYRIGVLESVSLSANAANIDEFRK